MTVAYIYKPVYNSLYKFITNGSFWYIFEYFLKTSEIYNQTEFIFVSNKKVDFNELKECLELRYSISIPFDKIVVLNYRGLAEYIKNIHSIVLDIDTYSDKFIEKVLKGKYICLLYTANCSRLINDKYFQKNIYHFAESDMYVKKIYFDALRIPSKIKEGVYVSLKERRSVSIEQFNERIKPILDKIDKKKLALVDNINSVFSKYLRSVNIDTIDCALNNIHSQFDTYIDCMLNNFDYAARMILESYYFGKNIVYIDNGLSDGAKKRYQDIKSKSIDKYSLKYSDEIIKECLRYA